MDRALGPVTLARRCRQLQHLALVYWSRSEEGVGWISIEYALVKSWPRDPAHPLLSPQRCHGLKPPSTLLPCPLLFPEWKMISPRGLRPTHPFPKGASRRLWTRRRRRKRRESLSNDTPPTPALSDGKVDYSAQRDYDLPIPSRKAIPDVYEHDNNDEKDEKVEGGDILVIEAG